ncbi:MAG TPA: metabolite traffic protein EboE [Planctomycetota bacterium]|nr:metabolite traffic protein EboE [Planctomycetota bacterium]
MTLGYCMNVHPGETLDEVCAALRGPAKRVRELSGEPGVGIYLADRAAREALTDVRALEKLGATIADSGLRVFTANAFPVGGFHGAAVKRAVYRPTWEEPARLEYTTRLAIALDRILPPGAPLTISTAPVSFRAFGKADLVRAGVFMAGVAQTLDGLAQESEREIALAVEPEPLATLQTAAELVSFLENHVFGGAGKHIVPEEISRRRVGACLDACHHAVVFEGIEDALATYARAGVRVVKAQLSSALLCKGEGIARLREFDEPRYLHQTFWKRGTAIESAEDISGAFPAVLGADEARSHFHVPLAWEGDGALSTTRPLLEKALPLIAKATDDLEVETYTWSVLPAATREKFGNDVSSMIAAELRWVRSKLG